jgi:hypothetical protein
VTKRGSADKSVTILRVRDGCLIDKDYELKMSGKK